MRSSIEIVPVAGFVATQIESLPELAGPAGLILLGVYTTVYVIKAIAELKNGKSITQSSTLTHIDKTVDAIDRRLTHYGEQLEQHSIRLTRIETMADGQAIEFERLRREGCKQLQRHVEVLGKINNKQEEK